MLKVKAGVKPFNLIIAAALANVAEDMGITLTITSGTDGKHMVGSRHYSGDALDVRTRGLTKAQVKHVMESVIPRLGPAYDVVAGV